MVVLNEQKHDLLANIADFIFVGRIVVVFEGSHRRLTNYEGCVLYELCETTGECVLHGDPDCATNSFVTSRAVRS